MKTDYILDNLNKMIPNPVCELNYNKDYELLIAVMLSAQCTDKRVNMVTGKIFNKYDLNDLANLNMDILEKELYTLGSYHKKAECLSKIAKLLLEKYNGVVPNNREFLESLPGVGRKTTNVVLSELFNVPTIAVDTHVKRVSKRLGYANEKDNEFIIEKKLMKIFKPSDYNKVNHQLLLLGRYVCTAHNPNCNKCLLKCKYKKTRIF